jgi:hypothetical protein
MKHILSIAMIGSLAACSGGAGGGGILGGRQSAEPVPEIVAVDTTLPTTDEGRFLGFTVASLGDGTIPGLWIETPLVTTETPGRVVAESGRQMFLTLRPSGGARNSGSRLSIAAFQQLGIPLTALPTLTVISDG